MTHRCFQMPTMFNLVLGAWLGFAFLSSTPPTTGQQNSGAINKTISLSSESAGVLLAKRYPRGDVELEITLHCSSPGVVLDTVGINAAPRGSFSLLVLSDFRVQVQIYDPQATSDVRIANGWHILISKSAIQTTVPARVVLRREMGKLSLVVNGKTEAQTALDTPLSGEPIYIGDFPGDDQWGEKFSIHPAMIGKVTVTYAGAPRPVGQTQPPDISVVRYPEVLDETGALSGTQKAAIGDAVRKLKSSYHVSLGVVVTNPDKVDTAAERSAYRQRMIAEKTLPVDSGVFLYAGDNRYYERNKSLDSMVSIDRVKASWGPSASAPTQADRVLLFLTNLHQLLGGGTPTKPVDTEKPTPPSKPPALPPSKPDGSAGVLLPPALKPIPVTRQEKVASAVVDAGKGGVVDTKSGLSIAIPGGSLDKSRTVTVYKAQVPVPEIKAGIIGEGKAEPLELLCAWDVDVGEQTNLFSQPVEVSIDLSQWKKADGRVPLIIPAISVDGKRWTYPACEVKGNRLVFQTRHLCPVAAYVGWKYIVALGSAIGLYMYTRGWEGLKEDVGTEMPFLGLEGKGLWWASVGPDPAGYQIYWSTTVAGNESGWRDEKGFLEVWQPMVQRYHEKLTGNPAQDGKILDQLKLETDALRRKYLMPTKVAEIDHALRTATEYLRGRGFQPPYLTLPVYLVSKITGDCGHMRNPWLGRRYMVFGANNDTDDVYATALHELFHHYQSGYGWQLVERKESLPFTEGSALLLELEARDDYAKIETYTGKRGVKIWNDLAQMDVYRDGLYASDVDLGHHGYGLSWFMEYLRDCRYRMGKDFHTRLLETWSGLTGTLHKTFLWAADTDDSSLGASSEETLGQRFISFAQSQVLKGMPSQTTYGLKYSRPVFSGNLYTVVGFPGKGYVEWGDKQIKPWSIQYLQLQAAARPKSTLMMRFPGEWFDYRPPGRAIFLRKSEGDIDAIALNDLNIAKGISKNPLVAMPFDKDRFLYIVDTGQTGSGWINEYKPAMLFVLEPPTEVKSRLKEGNMLEVTWKPPAVASEGTLVNRYFVYLTATPQPRDAVPLLKIPRVPADKNKAPYPIAEAERGKTSVTVQLPAGYDKSSLQVRMTTATVAGIPDGGKAVYFESELSDEPGKIEVTWKDSGYGDPGSLVKVEKGTDPFGRKYYVEYYRTTFTAIMKNAKEPCTYEWTSGGKTQTGRTATFDLLAPGQSLDGQKVSLKVTDADGKTAFASASYGGAF